MKRKPIKGLIWMAAVTGLLSGATAGLLLALTRDLPQIQSLESYKPSAITRIFSADQILLKELYVEKRDPVPLSQVPAYLKTALLTTEDRHFYDHSGLAVRGILRAMIQNMRKGRFAQGASTLTQQLAKTLFLTPRKTLSRKLREAILSIQLERRYTKDEILALYLNQIYFGSGAYGVASAAPRLLWQACAGPDAGPMRLDRRPAQKPLTLLTPCQSRTGPQTARYRSAPDAGHRRHQ